MPRWPPRATRSARGLRCPDMPGRVISTRWRAPSRSTRGRSEEHTSELQSQSNLVCRLLLEKKKRKIHKAANAYPIIDGQALPIVLASIVAYLMGYGDR